MVFVDTFKIKSSAQSLDVSAEFLQQKGDNYHEALGAKAHYNQLTTWFEPLPEPGDTTSDEDLRIALFEYNETTEERFRLNLASYTLNDVLLEIIEADGRYTARGKGVTHAHRQIARSTGNNAAAIGPWLGLIPSDEGLSVLTGGLKVILDVCVISKTPPDNRSSRYLDCPKECREPPENPPCFTWYSGRYIPDSEAAEYLLCGFKY